MSSDKRPAKVRVFSSRNGMPAQGQRRGDQVAPVDPTAKPVAAAPVAPPITRGRTVLFVLLFLIGCAIGGAALGFIALGGTQG